MKRRIARRRRRRSDHHRLVIRRRDLATAIQAGFDAWASTTGSGLHPGLRAEISAHLVAAITRAAEAQPHSPPDDPAPAAPRWWNDTSEQEGEHPCDA